MKALSTGKVDGIRADIRNGMKIRDIAAKHYVSVSTVNRLVKTVEDTSRRPKAGRPCKVTLTTRRHIVRNITSGELENAVEVQKHLKEAFNIDLTATRVRQILREENLTATHKKKKSKLAERHRKQRMEFARLYQHWTDAEWKKVL